MKGIANCCGLLILPGWASAADALPAAGPVVLQLLIVLAVIGACAWLIRRTPLARRTGKILQVKDSLSLGTRERLLVVRFEQRELLLGVNSQRITLLSERDAVAEPLDDGQATAEARSFLELLGQRP